MAAALIVYCVLSMALAALVVHRRENGLVKPPNPFDISLLAAGAITIFVVLAHAVLFGLSTTDFAALLSPSGRFIAEVVALSMAVALISWLVRRVDLPFAALLPQSFLITSFLLHRVNTINGVNAPLMPGWRFVGVAVALWASFLLIADIVTWVPHRQSDEEKPDTLLVSLKLFAVLPAILIYGLGLARGL